MIQYISFSLKASTFNDSNIVCSTLGSPKSLDEFDINIIDLNNALLWKNNGQSYTQINNRDDFENLYSMVRNSQTTNIVILFPQNCKFDYYFYMSEYRHSIELKNMRNELQKIVGILVNQSNFNLEYENTITNIRGKQVDACFYFNVNTENSLLKSNKSNKVTTMKIGERLIISTLNLDTYDKIMAFIKSMNLIKDSDPIPEWLHQVIMFDDEIQNKTISHYMEIIEKSKNQILLAEEKIKENNEYKSILFTNGDKLVEVVFKILNKLLDFNLSEFEDKKKEDFLIKKDDVG